jgi:hypothetical protein
MEVGLKQFVYCPSFSRTCLCSFVVLYGGGVALSFSKAAALPQDRSYTGRAAATALWRQPQQQHSCGCGARFHMIATQHTPPRPGPSRSVAGFSAARRVRRLLPRGTLRKCRATAAWQRCWRLARRICAARFAAERRRGRGCRSAPHGAAMSRPAPRPRPALCSAARAAPVRLARHLASGGAACASLRSAHGNAMSRTSPATLCPVLRHAGAAP